MELVDSNNTTSSQNCPLCLGPGRYFHSDEARGWRYRICDKCDLIWLDPKDRLRLNAEHAHYEQHNNKPEDPNYRAFLGRLWEPLKHRLLPGARGLDYGSGPGPTLHLMAQESGFSCEHYDPFFHRDDSVFEQRYDFITCSEAAEHFYHPHQEFKKLANLLKPDGWLGVMTRRYHTGLDFVTWHYRNDPTHVAFYSDRSFKFIARQYGFDDPEFLSESVVVLRKRS